MGATQLSSHLRKEVRPVFITDFTRSIRMLKFEGALIELGLDSGEIRAGKDTHPISELELELKSGEPLQLFRLALALFDIVPLEIETTSKAEYGYRLFVPHKSVVSKAQIPKLDTHTPIATALQSMIWSCLLHLQANVPGAINKIDDEYLHQVRVALRRLRVILNMAAKLRADEELDALRNIVAELCTALGRSREWDVFINEILPPILKGEDACAGQSTLAREVEKHRQASHQLVYSVLQASDFHHMLLRFGAWMHGEYWTEFSKSDNLLNIADEILHGYARKVRRRGNCLLEEVNNKELHKLRIACKNLRYSTELFVSLLDLEHNNHRSNLLVQLQDCLGKLNDNAVALHLLDELNKSAEIENIALIRDEINLSHKKHLKEFRSIWQHFIKLPESWR
jgi:inorganic triphosphatase YgiF